jgi:2-oxoglutarate dehydrogenase complex dehydrogenase (E1) component-like enzyme
LLFASAGEEVHWATAEALAFATLLSEGKFIPDLLFKLCP